MPNMRAVVIENAQFVFKNFEGKKRQYNSYDGDRNFGLLLDKDLSDKLRHYGYDVRTESNQDFLRVVVCSHKNQLFIKRFTRDLKEVLIDIEDYNLLDNFDLNNVTVVIMPYQWVVKEKTGIKAFLYALTYTN